jgi:hypothetical protein
MRFRSKAAVAAVGLCCALRSLAPAQAVPPITVDTKNLTVTVDPVACRWSASVKGTPMQINDVYFLPGGDASGWTVTSAINQNDANNLGSFVTVTLRGKKAGQLDFEYQISASKTNNDILVSLGRTNNTNQEVDIDEMDYFVSSDARLGSTSDRWIALGTQSRNRDYYDLWAVINLNTPKTYAVNHVVQDSDTGNSLLMGHVTTTKGASRFDVANGWKGKTPDRMRVRGYCSYNVTVPPGKSFPGEKLLIYFNTNALRAMEHQADLIALAHDIRLKERRPIDIDDRDWVSNDYARFHGWMSGSGGRGGGGGAAPGATGGRSAGSAPGAAASAAAGGRGGAGAGAQAFFQENGLVDFYWGMGSGGGGSMGFYGSGGSTSGRFPEFDLNTNWATYPDTAAGAAQGRSRVNYPPECFLPIRTVKYGGEKVIDFSNPLTIKLERERATQAMTGREKETGRVEMDFADWWDKWPGQFDPFMSSMETYHAGGMPWREAIDKLAPRKVVRSNMNVVDHSYGIVDICRSSEDADGGYEMGDGWKHLLTESILGTASRFFYSGRVFWLDPDGMHIYKFQSSYGSAGKFDYGQAKVNAMFHAIAGNAIFLSDALNEKYPDDRIELLKRISPPTMDVAYPVDLFVRKPAQIWNMPIERPFGNWSVLAVFNYIDKYTDNGREPVKFSTKLNAARDLRLDPNKEYIVYEFWSKKLIGTFQGSFTTPPVDPYDVGIYSIVEKHDRPVLISTSRHVRQMAFDIKDMAYDPGQRVLRGVSRAVAGDPYQLRIYVPDGFSAKRADLPAGITGAMKTDGNLLTVDFTAPTGNDVQWRVFF